MVEIVILGLAETGIEVVAVEGEEVGGEVVEACELFTGTGLT